MRASHELLAQSAWHADFTYEQSGQPGYRASKMSVAFLSIVKGLYGGRWASLYSRALTCYGTVLLSLRRRSPVFVLTSYSLTLTFTLHVAPRASGPASPGRRSSSLFRSGLLLSRRLLSRRLLLSVALVGRCAECDHSLPRSKTTVRHSFNTIYIFLFQFIFIFDEKMYQLFWYGVAACFTATAYPHPGTGLCLTRADRRFQDPRSRPTTVRQENGGVQC